MSEVAAVIASLREAGLTLRNQGGRLKVAGKVTPEARRLLDEHARAILDALAAADGQAEADYAAPAQTEAPCSYFVGEVGDLSCRRCGCRRPPHWRVKYTEEELEAALAVKWSSEPCVTYDGPFSFCRRCGYSKKQHVAP
jgi:hypothetical protein